MRMQRSPGTERLREGPLRLFRLADEIARLKGEADWTGGKRAITLTKQDGQRVVLLALRAGAKLDEHLAAGALTIAGLRILQVCHDAELRRRLEVLVDAMPPICRAYNLPEPEQAPTPGVLVEHFIALFE